MDTSEQTILAPQYMESDEALAKKCKDRDEEAFKVLMNRYMRQIFNFSRQYSKTAEDAEDITQDTFFKVWKYIGKYAENRPFKPWLYTIARNTALDFLKKKKTSLFSDLDDTENDLSFADTIEDVGPLQAEVFENAELSKKLLEMMNDIHPDHRAILIMHYHEDMTFDEIAFIVGKPMNTVKSWHRRALIKLKEKLLHHQQ